MDLSTALADPLIFTVIVMVAAACVGIYYFSTQGGGKKQTFLIERIRPHYNVLRQVNETKSPNPGDTVLALKDNRRFLIPKENEKECEILEVPRNMKIKKGYRKLWMLENNQIVAMGERFVDDMRQLITPDMISPLLNRGSLRRLATAKGGPGGGWTLVILACGMGLALGYIMYPQFNHAQGVVEYCKTVSGAYQCGLTP